MMLPCIQNLSMLRNIVEPWLTEEMQKAISGNGKLRLQDFGENSPASFLLFQAIIIEVDGSVNPMTIA